MRAAQPAVYNDDLSSRTIFKQIAPPFLIALPGCLCLFFSCLQLSAGRLQKPLIYLGKISYGLYVYHVLWLGVGGHLTEHFATGRLSPVTSHLWRCRSHSPQQLLPAHFLTASLRALFCS